MNILPLWLLNCSRAERIVSFDHGYSRDMSRAQTGSNIFVLHPLESKLISPFLRRPFNISVSHLQRCRFPIVINDGNLKGDVISTVLRNGKQSRSHLVALSWRLVSIQQTPNFKNLVRHFTQHDFLLSSPYLRLCKFGSSREQMGID
jgi:hypothetical protein